MTCPPCFNCIIEFSSDLHNNKCNSASLCVSVFCGADFQFSHLKNWGFDCREKKTLKWKKYQAKYRMFDLPRAGGTQYYLRFAIFVILELYEWPF